MKKLKQIASNVLLPLVVGIVGNLFALGVLRLSGDQWDKFVAHLNDVGSLVAVFLYQLVFVVVFVSIWWAWQKGWPRLWLRKVRRGAANPASNDLNDLNKTIQECLHRLKGVGVLYNLNVVGTEILWRRLHRGLERHDIPLLSDGASGTDLYSYLMDLEDPTRRDDIEEARRIARQHADRIKSAEAESPQTDDFVEGDRQEMKEPILDATTRYVWKNFAVAQHRLVTDDGDLRMRLHKASLDIGPSFESDVPTEFREEMSDILEKLTLQNLQELELSELETVASRIAQFADNLEKYITSGE